ncbi:GDSL-type esterase/lipase family protein [Mesobacillus subterraneus]|uniref:SGNH/GDSL hydrolase family protein n=1 Tax=Mesobacillus subterraneus TaxID=285983 RepID=UPI001CFD6513|nr:GDSL-type esterase/lipase family protein [Mesobacillus subterraneus]WLR55196.1 GDSL-type esterase/lipase family protein [Mesobacillus subterraneus]
MDLIFGGIVVLLLIPAVSFLFYFQRKSRINQLPHNHPKAFLEKGLRQEGKKLVAVIGGDAVHGNISYNFVEDAARRKNCKDYQFINAGVNGSTAYDVLQRLDDIIACQPEYVVILVGLNDASAKIAPDLAKKNIKLAQQLEKPSLLVYEKNLGLIVSRLKAETSAKIGLLSLPVVGENLFSKANKEIDQYNEVIKKTAEMTNVSYLSFNEKLKAYLKGKGHTRGRSLKAGTKLYEKAIIEHFVYGYSLDRISARNGYLLLTDGMHLNSTAGMMAAHQIELFIKKNELKAIQ